MHLVWFSMCEVDLSLMGEVGSVRIMLRNDITINTNLILTCSFFTNRLLTCTVVHSFHKQVIKSSIFYIPF